MSSQGSWLIPDPLGNFLFSAMLSVVTMNLTIKT